MIHYADDNVIVRDSEESDIGAMKDRLRKLDADEVWASAHQTPEQALYASYWASLHRLTVVYRGEVAAMFGVVPESLLSRRAVVWMLTTEAIDKMKVRFLKLSRVFIHFLREQYPVLLNFVDARHAPCLKWLRWCGARISPHTAYGPEGMPFHYFELGGQ